MKEDSFAAVEVESIVVRQWSADMGTVQSPSIVRVRRFGNGLRMVRMMALLLYSTATSAPTDESFPLSRLLVNR